MSRKTLALLLLLVLVAAFLIACSSNKGSHYVPIDDSNDYDSGASNDEKPGADPPVNNSGDVSDRKIVKTVTLSLETKKFDEAVRLIEQFVTDNNGYIESSNIAGSSYTQSRAGARTAAYVIRVPVDALDNYVDAVGENFNVTEKKESAQDISDTYYDTESRLNAYMLQEERLLDMLQKATTLDYILQLEDKLASVRYNIESLTAKIRRYDNLVAYSTVNITLKEVMDYTLTEQPKTFFERWGTAFTEGWHSFAVATGEFVIGLTYALPVLLVLAAACVVLVLVVRAVNKRRQRKWETLLNSQNTSGESNAPKA